MRKQAKNFIELNNLTWDSPDDCIADDDKNAWNRVGHCHEEGLVEVLVLGSHQEVALAKAAVVAEGAVLKKNQLNFLTVE